MFVVLCVSLWWGLGLFWTKNIPPTSVTPQSCSPTAILFFSLPSALLLSPHHTNTHSSTVTSPAPSPVPQVYGRTSREIHTRRGWRERAGQPGEEPALVCLLKLFSSGWQICSDISSCGNYTRLRGWGRTTIICPAMMLLKLFFMLARR